MTERETARRVFAREFNDSGLQHGENTERSPNFLITPTGAMCNRVFIVGVLTEVENIGDEGRVLYRARVADPTGVFTVYAGQYQQSAAVFLSKAMAPAYVAVVGKARVFSPENGSFYTSIRPEDINMVDEYVRNRWIYNTAENTIRRIRLMEKALASGFRGAELTRYMATDSNDTEGISKAIDHYSITQNSLDAYKHMVLDALSTILDIVPPADMDTRPEAEDITSIVAETIARLDQGSGVSYEQLLQDAEHFGLLEADVENAINVLMDSGRCYEPKIGVLRLI